MLLAFRSAMLRQLFQIQLQMKRTIKPPFFPSMSRADEWVCSINYTKDLLHSSRMELRLQFYLARAQQSPAPAGAQSVHMHNTVNILQVIQNQPEAVQDGYAKADNCSNCGLSCIQTPNMLDLRRDSEIEKPFTFPKKSLKAVYDSNWKVREKQYEFSFRKQGGQKSQSEEQAQLITLFVPLTNQKIVTNFEEIGVSHGTVKELKQKVVEGDPSMVDLIHYDTTHKIATRLDDGTKIAEIIVKPDIILKFIANEPNPSSNRYSVRNKYGEVVLRRRLEQLELVSIKQDIICVDDSLMPSVISLTYYNFGASSPRFSNYRKKDPQKFKRMVKKMAKSQNMEVVHLGVDLILKPKFEQYLNYQ